MEVTNGRTGRLVLVRRQYIEYNDDPQRRCYNGCHASTAFYWGPWESLQHFPDGTELELIESKLKFWRELNADAVKARGNGALCEFAVIPEEDYKGLD
jgi:hypothetical protein